MARRRHACCARPPRHSAARRSSSRSVWKPWPAELSRAHTKAPPMPLAFKRRNASSAAARCGPRLWSGSAGGAGGGQWAGGSRSPGACRKPSQSSRLRQPSRRTCVDAQGQPAVAPQLSRQTVVGCHRLARKRQQGHNRRSVAAGRAQRTQVEEAADAAVSPLAAAGRCTLQQQWQQQQQRRRRRRTSSAVASGDSSSAYSCQCTRSTAAPASCAAQRAQRAQRDASVSSECALPRIWALPRPASHRPVSNHLPSATAPAAGDGTAARWRGRVPR